MDIIKPGLARKWLRPEGDQPMIPMPQIKEESKGEMEAEEEEEGMVAEDVKMESYDLEQQAKILEDLHEIFGIKATPSSRQKKLKR